MISKLVEKYPKLDTLLLPLLVFVLGLLMYVGEGYIPIGLPFEELGLALMTFAIGSHADLRWFAKTWVMRLSPELGKKLG